MAVETRVIIDANASNAIRALEDLDRTAGDVDKSLEQLDGATVDVDTSDAVDNLREVEFTGADVLAAIDKLDASRVTITADTSDVVAAGADLDQVEAKTKDPYRIEFDVDTDKLDRVKRSADDIDSSGRAASTAIGGIGNTVSELPGIGALGGMAESMGQLAEGALEGDINLSALVATAGGLAAVAFIAGKVGEHFEQIAATKAWRKEQVQSYTEELRDADTALEGIIEKLKAADGVEIRLLDQDVDVTAKLTEAGLSVEQFARLVEEGQPSIDAYAEAMKQAGVDTETTNLVVLAAKQQHEAFTGAAEGAAVAARFFGDEQKVTTAAVEDATRALDGHAGNLAIARTRTNELEAANRALRGDLSDREAYLNLETTLEELGAAGIQAMEDVASGAVDAETATRDFELQQIAAKEAVLDYIDQIGKVPAEKQTEILALIDQGKYDEAETALDTLATDRDVKINVYGNIDPKLLNTPYLPYIPKPAASTANNLTVNVTATPSMRETDAAITRWQRINGNG